MWTGHILCRLQRQNILSDWNIVFRAIEADGGVHHGTYHRSERFFECQFKFSPLKVTHLILEFILQQVWGRIFHHLLLPSLAHRPPTLPWHCHLCYQVWTLLILIFTFPWFLSAFFVLLITTLSNMVVLRLRKYMKPSTLRKVPSLNYWMPLVEDEEQVQNWFF